MKKMIICAGLCATILFSVQAQAGQALFGEWRFNDGSGTVARDTSGYGNNAILSGAPGWSSDCFTFTGSNHFRVPHTASSFQVDMSKSFTLSMSIRTTQLGVGVLFSRHNGAWVSGGKEIYINGGYVSFSGYGVGTISGSTYVSDGFWHDLMLSYDDSTGILSTYVDGFLDASQNMSNLSTVPDNFDIYIAVEAAWAHFVGDMKDLRIYQFPTKAYNPVPSNNNAGVNTSVNQLSWQTPEATYTYDVYFSTVMQDVNSNAAAAKRASAQSTLSLPVTLAVGQTYYWKVNCIKPDNTVIAGDLWKFTTVSYKAYNASPAIGTDNTSIYKQLGWSAGLNATSHKVYFSDKFADVNQGTVSPATVTTTSYNPGVLKLDKTYYWRVDEVAGTTTTRGDIWSFETNAQEIIDDFQYFSDGDLRAAWVGPGTNLMSSPYYHTWMTVPYSTTDQTFYRTFTTPLNLSTGAVLSLEYRHDLVDTDAEVIAPVTISLMDASNNVLLSVEQTNPAINWPSTDFGLYVAKWDIPIWSMRASVTAVKKIGVKVGATPSPSANDAFYIDNLSIGVPTCPTPISGDLDGDCQVTFADFAVMAGNWLKCNRMPAEACWSF